MAERLTLLHGTYSAVTDIYEKVDPILAQLSPWIMPEHFWFLGYKERDQSAMQKEADRAKTKVAVLEERCAHYPEKALQALEGGYAKILQELEALEGR